MVAYSSLSQTELGNPMGAVRAVDAVTKNLQSAADSIIGACIGDPMAAVDAIALIRAEDMPPGRHRVAFLEIAKLVNGGGAVDLVAACVACAGRVESSWLSSLTGGPTGPAHLKQWAEIVKECSGRLRMAEAGRRLTTGALDPLQNPQLLAEQHFEALGAGGQVENRKKRFFLTRIAEIVTNPADWLVTGILERESLALLFGDSEAGKSFVAVDVTCCIATGTPWHGRTVGQGPVVVIAGEGQKGLKRRFMAWGIRHGLDVDQAPVFVSSSAASFLDRQSMADVEEAIDEVVADCGNPALIVVDTLARNFGPGDENSTQDMGEFVRAADTLRQRYHAAVLLVHHTGHGNKERARGGYALKCSLDFEYRLERGADGITRLDCSKCKDFERPAPMAFRLRSVELPLKDEQGQPVTGAVFDLVEHTLPPKAPKGGWGKNQVRVLDLLCDLITHHKKNLEQDGRDPEGARVTVEEWRLHCQEKADMNSKRFGEARRALEDQKAVEVENGFVRIAQV